MKRLLAWALEEGFGDPSALDEDWGQFALRIMRRELSPDAFAPLDATLSAFFATRTKAEVVEAACKRKLLLAPLLDLGEFADSPQLAARGFARRAHARGGRRAAALPGPVRALRAHADPLRAAAAAARRARRRAARGAAARARAGRARRDAERRRSRA